MTCLDSEELFRILFIVSCFMGFAGSVFGYLAGRAMQQNHERGGV